MTKAQLIQALERFPDDMQVTILDGFAVSIHRPFGILCKGDDGQIMIDVLTNGDKIELRGTMERKPDHIRRTKSKSNAKPKIQRRAT